MAGLVREPAKLTILSTPHCASTHSLTERSSVACAGSRKLFTHPNTLLQKLQGRRIRSVQPRVRSTCGPAKDCTGPACINASLPSLLPLEPLELCAIGPIGKRNASSESEMQRNRCR